MSPLRRAGVISKAFPMREWRPQLSFLVRWVKHH
jgi:hypothetical protein